MKVRVSSRKTRIEIMPLIDVIFLLLVFFIYAMMSMAVHHGVPVNLPSGFQGVVVREDLPSLTLAKDGSIFLNKVKVTREELGPRLRLQLEGSGQQGLLLFADQEVPYKDIFDVVEEIAKAGISNISLQSRMEKKM